MSDQLIQTQTKRCPRCAEDIKAEAVVCRYCGTEFTITRQGYCPSCHKAVQPTATDACPDCSGSLVDIHVESEPLNVSVPSVSPPTPGPTVAPSPTVGAEPIAAAPAARSLVRAGREGLVPTGIQKLGWHGLRATVVVLFLTMLAGFVALGLTSSAGDSPMYGYWHMEDVGFATEVMGPPVLVVLLAVLFFFLQPKILKPRGGWIPTRGATYLREFKKRFGAWPLKLQSLRPMLMGSILTLALILVISIAFVTDHASGNTGGAAYVTIIATVVGIVSALLLWPNARSKTITMEDDGTVHG